MHVSNIFLFLYYTFDSTAINVFCYGFISATSTSVVAQLEAMVNISFSNNVCIGCYFIGIYAQVFTDKAYSVCNVQCSRYNWKIKRPRYFEDFTFL